LHGIRLAGLQRLQQLRQRRELEHSYDWIPEENLAFFMHMHHSMQFFDRVPLRVELLWYRKRHGRVRMHRLPGKRYLPVHRRKRLYLYLRQRILQKRNIMQSMRCSVGLDTD
jgi:hypothetical protein